ncbi:MAG TPA: GNAT family N-acetyltransferase, partial [Tepidisphaeraceae bacterium]|nr:GNAT family N-acetyltransferase [Tepidisphaeraceae bacterium]
ELASIRQINRKPEIGIALRPVSHKCIAEFKANRLRALSDAPLAFGSTYARESLLTDDQWRERVEQWSGNRGCGYLAWDGPTACGIVGCFLDTEDRSRAHLISMWVAPAQRHRGAGRMLVDAAASWAESRGATSLYLSVTSCNDAGRIFYERLGFTATGRTEPYPNIAKLVEIEMARSSLSGSA